MADDPKKDDSRSKTATARADRPDTVGTLPARPRFNFSRRYPPAVDPPSGVSGQEWLAERRSAHLWAHLAGVIIATATLASVLLGGFAAILRR